jgi:membrane protein required for colicin V production
MTAFDIIVLLPLIWGAYRGFSKGLIMETATLVALFLGVFLAVKFSDTTADILNVSFSINPKYLSIVAFTVTFLAVVLTVIITAKLVERFAEAAELTTANKIGGSALGLLKYALGISVVIFLLNCAGKNGTFFSEETRSKSYLYKPLSAISAAILPMNDIKQKVEDAGKSLQSAGTANAASPGQP